MRAARAPRSVPAWIALAFFISGFAALVYQVVWQRALFTIFGINTESVTVIVTVFLLGLGVGSIAGGALSKQPARPLLLFSLAELGIAAFGVVSLDLFARIGAVSVAMSTLAVDFVTFALLLVPTLLMGMTLPLLVAHLVRISGNVGQSVGMLYFVNTAGSGLAALAAFVYLANLVGYLVLPGLAHLATRSTWTTALPLVVPASGLWGAALPLVSHFGIEPDAASGARLSRLYVANIAGSVMGTLLTGFVLLDVWPIQVIALALVLLGLALSAGLLGAGGFGGRRLVAGLVVIGATAAAYVAVTPRLFDFFYERLLFARAFDGASRFADVVENRSGVIAITPKQEVFGGGAYDGVISTSLVDDRNMIVRAYGIAALHPAPRRVLMIGLATGGWAQVLANMPGVGRLTVIEINPGYLELIRKYPAVASLLRNPKVEIVIDDGRRWLARHPSRSFDVVVSNTTFHWRAHSTNLLSAEFLRLVRAHLEPGGIFHYNTTDSPDAFKTAFTVFPYGMRFINFATVSDAPISIDLARWQRTLDAYAVDGVPIFDPGRAVDRRRRADVLAFMRSIDGLPRHFGLERRESMLPRLSTARVITDDNMLPEWSTTSAAPYPMR